LDQCTGHHFEPEAAIEIRVVRDDEHDPPKQIVEGAIVNTLTSSQGRGGKYNLAAAEVRAERQTG
jgi:hypothetical protein